MSIVAMTACQQRQRYHHTQFDSPMRPERQDNETLAQYRWRFLRIALKQAVQLAIEFEEKNLIITHGMHFFRRFPQNRSIFQVTYMKSIEVCGDLIL